MKTTFIKNHFLSLYVCSTVVGQEEEYLSLVLNLRNNMLKNTITINCEFFLNFSHLTNSFNVDIT